MFGLTSQEKITTFHDINFAIYLAGNHFKVYELGYYKGDFGILDVGDVVRVGLTQDAVNYYRNATSVYTSRVRPQYPMWAAASINTSLSKLTDVFLCSDTLSTTLP
jgi:hypothetical protein